MIQISLTDFVDFINSSGTTRLVKVREIAQRGDYHPSHDYYKQVRDIIVENRRAAASANDLLKSIGIGHSDHKREHFAQILNGVGGFFGGRRRLDWFEPPDGYWTTDELAIRVNPELGLSINGERHTIKLHFKESPIAPRHAAVVNHLMRRALEQSPQMRFAVLDTRTGKLLRSSSQANLDALLAGEASSFATMYRQSVAA